MHWTIDWNTIVVEPSLISSIFQYFSIFSYFLINNKATPSPPPGHGNKIIHYSGKAITFKWNKTKWSLVIFENVFKAWQAVQCGIDIMSPWMVECFNIQKNVQKMPHAHGLKIIWIFLIIVSSIKYLIISLTPWIRQDSKVSLWH